MEALTKQERKQIEHDRRKRTIDGARVKGETPSARYSSGGGQPVSVIQSSNSMSTTKLQFNQPLKSPAIRPALVMQPSGLRNSFGSTRPSSALRGSSDRFIHPHQQFVIPSVRSKGSFAAAAAQHTVEHFAQPLVKRARTSMPTTTTGEQSLSITIDRLLSATQSMGLFLNSLTNELRNAMTVSTSGPLAAQTSKRKEVAGKLWRAYRAYSNSFQEIGGLGGLLKSTSPSGEGRSLAMYKSAPYPISIVAKCPEGMMAMSTQGFAAVRSSVVQSVRAPSTVTRWTSSTASRITPRSLSVSTIVKPASVPRRNNGSNVKQDNSIVIELSDSEEELLKDAASIASSVFFQNRDAALRNSSELERHLKSKDVAHLNGRL